MAMGEVQVAKREGHKVQLGTGLTKDGNETTDPGEIADGGVLITFWRIQRLCNSDDG